MYSLEFALLRDGLSGEICTVLSLLCCVMVCREKYVGYSLEFALLRDGLSGEICRLQY